MIALWLLLGLLGAAVYVRIGRTKPLAWWALGLAVAAGLYVVFALARGDGVDALIEAGGVMLYGAVAWLGVRRGSEGLVAVGWALHPAWDLGVHLGTGVEAPAWYIWLCLSFDLVVAGALLVRAHRHPAEDTRPAAV